MKFNEKLVLNSYIFSFLGVEDIMHPIKTTVIFDEF